MKEKKRMDRGELRQNGEQREDLFLERDTRWQGQDGGAIMRMQGKLIRGRGILIVSTDVSK